MGRGTGLGFNDLTEEEDILLPYTLKKSSPISSLVRPPFTNPLPLPVDSMLENILFTNRLHALSHHSF